MFVNHALDILHKACVEQGILATALSTPKDNYQAVWSRDASFAGIVGVLWEDTTISEALLRSLHTLAKNQHPLGMIPSNVSIDGKVSYGSLVGRVDATTWFICSLCVYLSCNPSHHLKKQFLPCVESCMQLLETWEFNARDLIYTPMSGNWADEYVTQGYTLYDQCLRLWGLTLAARVWSREDWQQKAICIKEKIKNHYQFDDTFHDAHHQTAYSSIKGQSYWACSFGAFGYDQRFDMTANALACLLGIDHRKNIELFNYMDVWVKKEGTHLLPVFFPVITPKDSDWKYLQHNYSYRFKNQPYHFHNGGIWPVFLAFLGASFAVRGNQQFAQNLYDELHLFIKTNQYTFPEYIAADTMQPAGVSSLCFTASGVLLLHLFLHATSPIAQVWNIEQLLYEK